MEEIWKPVVGFEGLYEISNFGRVKGLERNIVTKSGHTILMKEIIKKTTIRDKHFIVGLSKNGKTIPKMVHRLMAIAFIPIPDKYNNVPLKDMDVHHIDFNPLNNKVENLIWLTKSEHKLLHLSVNHHFKGKHHTEESKRKISEGKKGRLHTEEERRKISEAHKGKPLSEDTKRKISEAHKGDKCCWFGKKGKEHPNSKPIIQYTKDRVFIREWDSISDASRELECSLSGIVNALTGKAKTSNNFIWKYKE